MAALSWQRLAHDGLEPCNGWRAISLGNASNIDLLNPTNGCGASYSISPHELPLQESPAVAVR
jgi:hypothetical protein